MLGPTIWVKTTTGAYRRREVIFVFYFPELSSQPQLIYFPVRTIFHVNCSFPNLSYLYPNKFSVQFLSSFSACTFLELQIVYYHIHHCYIYWVGDQIFFGNYFLCKLQVKKVMLKPSVMSHSLDATTLLFAPKSAWC